MFRLSMAMCRAVWPVEMGAVGFVLTVLCLGRYKGKTWAENAR